MSFTKEKNKIGAAAMRQTTELNKSGLKELITYTNEPRSKPTGFYYLLYPCIY